MRTDNVSRRELLKVGATAAALVMLPRPLMAHFGGKDWEPLPPIQDPKIKELAMKAVAASKAAGATYADVRLTHIRKRDAYSGGTGYDAEEMHVGVRALVNGYWGFASSGVWSPDEMTRLAQAAVALAKANALGKSRTVNWAPAPAVADGHWVMPVKHDPFEVAWGEIVDVLKGIEDYGQRFPVSGIITNMAKFFRQDQAFASTDGSYYTQRIYRSQGVYGFDNESIFGGGGRGSPVRVGLDFLSAAGIGWELYTDHQPLQDAIRQLADEVEQDSKLPEVGVEVGRYDTVMDQRTLADLLTGTLGRATQIDRALGYEANANGTSYLRDPVAMIGTFPVAAPLLSVTANRSDPGSCATVQWDDEGVQPEAFPLVQKGILADFQTSREGAGWLADAYAKQQRPVRSHGCAIAPSGWEAPLVHTPNLVVEPGQEAQDFDTLVGGLKTGIAIKAAHHPMRDPMSRIDFQCLNGTANGRLYMVKNGRRVARLVPTGGILFRSQNLWESLLSVGNAASARRFGMPSDISIFDPIHPESKGEPPQLTYHSVTAPPALFKQATLIDLQRQP